MSNLYPSLKGGHLGTETKNVPLEKSHWGAYGCSQKHLTNINIFKIFKNKTGNLGKGGAAHFSKNEMGENSQV